MVAPTAAMSTVARFTDVGSVGDTPAATAKREQMAGSAGGVSNAIKSAKMQNGQKSRRG